MYRHEATIGRAHRTLVGDEKRKERNIQDHDTLRNAIIGKFEAEKAQGARESAHHHDTKQDHTSSYEAVGKGEKRQGYSKMKR
jgi:hypothetical protein